VSQVAAEVSPSYPERFMYCHIPALDLEQQELVGILQTCITFIHNARQQGMADGEGMGDSPAVLEKPVPHSCMRNT
jgi:hypothetical protein